MSSSCPADISTLDCRILTLVPSLVPYLQLLPLTRPLSSVIGPWFARKVLLYYVVLSCLSPGTLCFYFICGVALPSAGLGKVVEQNQEERRSGAWAGGKEAGSTLQGR